jgi:hypothetical protein
VDFPFSVNVVPMIFSPTRQLSYNTPAQYGNRRKFASGAAFDSGGCL